MDRRDRDGSAATGKRPSFSAVVANDLKEMIRRDKLRPGDRIPTEAELCVKYGVSRTVVREAIVRLRSEGVLIARQGIGVFVGEGASARFEVDWSAIRTLPKTIMVTELRLAIEVEAAGLCAERRTKADVAHIRRLMDRIDAVQGDPKSTAVLYDFQFHLAIAKASKNPHIYELLQYMAPVVMPRLKLAAVLGTATKDAFYSQTRGEHEGIVGAIEKSDPAAARKQMRAHITSAIERLRRLAASLPPSEAKAAYEASPELLQSFARGLVEDDR